MFKLTIETESRDFTGTRFIYGQTAEELQDLQAGEQIWAHENLTGATIGYKIERV